MFDAFIMHIFRFYSIDFALSLPCIYSGKDSLFGCRKIKQQSVQETQVTIIFKTKEV
jgi:hypothetical protein